MVLVEVFIVSPDVWFAYDMLPYYKANHSLRWYLVEVKSRRLRLLINLLHRSKSSYYQLYEKIVPHHNEFSFFQVQIYLFSNPDMCYLFFLYKVTKFFPDRSSFFNGSNSIKLGYGHVVLPNKSFGYIFFLTDSKHIIPTRYV